MGCCWEIWKLASKWSAYRLTVTTYSGWDGAEDCHYWSYWLLSTVGPLHFNFIPAFQFHVVCKEAGQEFLTALCSFRSLWTPMNDDVVASACFCFGGRQLVVPACRWACSLWCVGCWSWVLIKDWTLSPIIFRPVFRSWMSWSWLETVLLTVLSLSPCQTVSMPWWLDRVSRILSSLLCTSVADGVAAGACSLDWWRSFCYTMEVKRSRRYRNTNYWRRVFCIKQTSGSKRAGFDPDS